MEYENFTFGEALKHLADRAGVELPKMEYSREVREKAQEKAELLDINKQAAQYYYYQLRTEKGAAGLRYLTDRGLTEETMRSFGLGYSDRISGGLYRYLKSKGYKDERLRESGLFNVDERHGMYDKFWNRVIFPIMDVNNPVIGFGGRVMGDGKPKYLNSPETRIFDKSRNLYGLNVARKTRKSQPGSQAPPAGRTGRPSHTPGTAAAQHPGTGTQEANCPVWGTPAPGRATVPAPPADTRRGQPLSICGRG